MATEQDQQEPQQQPPLRACPDCGGTNTELIQRGYAGATDERDQYYVCDDCGRTTYEIVSRTIKEIRIERLETGRQTRISGADYIVTRVLKAGVNESLIYVKPIPPNERKSRPEGRLSPSSKP